MSTRHKRRNKKHYNSHMLFKAAMIALVLLAGTCLGAVIFAARSLPAWNPDQLTGSSTTILYDDKGDVIGGLHAGENRTDIELDQVPQNLINAFIATEDQDFYHHHGVNFKGILRAVVRNVESGDLTSQGASTITQQLARNAFLTSDKRWERKVKEILLAFKLESNFSKDEILQMYLNKIYFGAGAYGVQAASQTYFGKNVGDLSLEECALLAGLVQSPNNYMPFQHYDKAKARQLLVLDNMVKCGYIDQAAADAAAGKELHFKKVQNASTRYGYYIDAVVEEAIDILGQTEDYEDDPNSAIYKSGLKIYTGMNSNMQELAEDLFVNSGNFPSESKNGQQIQSGMAIVDDTNGQVKAVMGGRKYEQQRGFNRATDAYRQPGSSIKPISVYGPALEKGFMPFHVLDDSPLSYKTGGTVWKPENYDHKYRGLITMRTAVQNSINTYAVQMLNEIGISSGFRFAKSLGLDLVDKKGSNDLNLASLSLGGLTKGATPVQMAAAYGAFGNSGVYVKPHFISKIVDANGVTIYKYQPESKRVMSTDTAWLMTSMLQTVVQSGTGTNARIPGVMAAGKTGTSEEYRDSWFCGYVPGFSGAVWMGYDQKYTMSQVYGGGYPARIWKAMMQEALKTKRVSPQSKPGDIIQVGICQKSGKLPSEACPDDQIISEYCVSEYAPKETCDKHKVVSICPESGKLATKFCPHPVLKSMLVVGENSYDPDKMPTQECDIHKSYTLPSLLTNKVWVCRDPRNEGKLYRANIPNAAQTGGCPDEYLEEVVLSPGETLSPCPIDSHRLKAKKVRDIINDITN
ncbi:MAG TPA: PBP1A family penicillin-binding protein [Syntrophomonadaceae bacterium]|nr:PBP1A family penicillin-binding protein [Syntrophomonadaceae bacterium]